MHNNIPVFKQRVVCAAARHPSGHIICSPRHYDHIFHQQVGMLPEEHQREWRSVEQGFVDQRGTFLTREEALAIAITQDQIIRDQDLAIKKLYSENLY
jgi:hypothetical protein